MMKIVSLLVLWALTFSGGIVWGDDVPSELYQSSLKEIKVALAELESGRLEPASEALKRGRYYLDSLRKDFPKWKVASPAVDSGPRTCLWSPMQVGTGYDLEPGSYYVIELERRDDGNISLRWKLAGPWSDPARISVAIDTGGGVNILQDGKNTDLFQGSEGEFILKPQVPSGSKIFLSGLQVGPLPIVLSNIEEIP